jgi:hypothetical protein
MVYHTSAESAAGSGIVPSLSLPGKKLSTPGFLGSDAYYANHRNLRNIVVARHNS